MSSSQADTPSSGKGVLVPGSVRKPWQDTESDLGDQIRGYGVKCYMSPTRFGSRATTTTMRSDVRSSSCICVSGRQWSTASVCGASSTAAVTGAQAAEVLGTAAWTVSCPIGQQNIARSDGATSSCRPASSFRGNAGGGSWNMQWDCRGGGEYLRNDKKEVVFLLHFR